MIEGKQIGQRIMDRLVIAGNMKGVFIDPKAPVLTLLCTAIGEELSDNMVALVEAVAEASKAQKT